MKRLLLFLFLIISTITFSQETYNIKGENFELITAIEGDLDLLWNTIDGKYRYFIRKNDGTIVELTNTRKDGKYQHEYREIVKSLDTENVINADKLNLTLFELRKFVDKHNMAVDSSYQSQLEDIKIQFRFEAFAGATNNPFVENSDNLLLPQVGFSFEMIDFETLRRHALFLNGRQVFKREDFEYSLTELALGYRFRVIDQEKFSVYANVIFGVVSHLQTIVAFEAEDGEIITEDFDGTEFDAPLSFGIGADYRISGLSFITVGFNELFSATLENRGNFPVNFTIGYKTDL